MDAPWDMAHVLYMPIIDVFYDFYWAQFFFTTQYTTSQNHPNITSTFEFDSRGISNYSQLISSHTKKGFSDFVVSDIPAGDRKTANLFNSVVFVC